MSNLDIVYIKGNPASGTALQHKQMNAIVYEFIKEYSYEIIDSQAKNLSGFKLPDSKIYIGFSRGSRYLKKLDSKCLKISIGGISGSKIHLFKNKNDEILLGNISDASMNAHFIILNEDKNKIKTLIDNYLNNKEDVKWK